MKFLSKKEVCSMLNISLATLNRLMKNGKLKYYKNGTSRTSGVKFNKKDVMEYVKSLKIGG